MLKMDKLFMLKCKFRLIETKVMMLAKPKMEKIVSTKMNKKASRNCFACPSGHHLFEVSDGDDQYVVNIYEKSCTCLDWGLSGIPCKHAIAAIVLRREKAEDYVHNYYLTKTFNKIYEPMMYPVPGSNDWPSTDKAPVQPPIVLRPPGRPKLKRVKGKNERKKTVINPYKASRAGKDVICSFCKKTGHNKRTCFALRKEDPKQSRKEKNKLYMRKKRAASKEMASQEFSIVGVGASSENKAASKQQVQQAQYDPDLQIISNKREAAKAKLIRKRKQPDKETLSTEMRNFVAQKREAALAKQAAKQRERDGCFETISEEDAPMGNDMLPKRKKLQIMRKEMKQNVVGSTSETTHLSNIAGLMNTIGIAQAELDASRNRPSEFVQLQTSVGSRASRFSIEARFKRGVKNNLLGSSSQPARFGGERNEVIGGQSHSQPK